MSHNPRAGAALAALLLVASSLPSQTCYEAPTPTAPYRADWGPKQVDWPSGLPANAGGLPVGLWHDQRPGVDRLLILTTDGLFQAPVTRGAQAEIVGFGAAQLLVSNFRQPVPWQTLAVVGDRAFAVAWLRSSSWLYEFDLSNPAVQAHQIAVSGRVHAVLADPASIPTGTDPYGLVLMNWDGDTFALNATKSARWLTINGTTPLRTLSGGKRSLQQPVYIPAGERAFSSTRRSLVIPFFAPGLNSTVLVYECSTAGLGSWLPERQGVGRPIFFDGGEIVAMARDRSRGDVILSLRRSDDGLTRRSPGPIFYVLRRGVQAEGCSLAAQGGSGVAPYPALDEAPGSRFRLGGQFGYEVSNAPPGGGIGVLILSLFPNEFSPLPGLFLLQFQTVGIPHLSGLNGRWSSGLFPIGNDANLVGLRVYSQAAYLRPRPSTFTASGVMRFVVR